MLARSVITVLLVASLVGSCGPAAQPVDRAPLLAEAVRTLLLKQLPVIEQNAHLEYLFVRIVGDDAVEKMVLRFAPEAVLNASESIRSRSPESHVLHARTHARGALMEFDLKHASWNQSQLTLQVDTSISGTAGWVWSVTLDTSVTPFEIKSTTTLEES